MHFFIFKNCIFIYTIIYVYINVCKYLFYHEFTRCLDTVYNYFHAYIYMQMLRIFLFESSQYLFHYLITIDDRCGLLVLISIVQIQNKLFQNLTKPLQCYANWYARYIRQISKQIFRISSVMVKMKKRDFRQFRKILQLILVFY